MRAILTNKSRQDAPTPKVTYKIVRHYFRGNKGKILKTGLTLEQAQEHCNDPETSSETCQKAVNKARTKSLGALVRQLRKGKGIAKR